MGTTLINCFDKNTELWSKIDPKHALMLPYHDAGNVKLIPRDGLPNGKLKIKNQWIQLHSDNPKKEADEWFASLDLNQVKVLFVFGVGLGHYYQAAKTWLKSDSNRRIVFLENNLSVIHLFFETSQATTMLTDEQVQLLYFDDLKDQEAVFEMLYWNYAFARFSISALTAYQEIYKKIYEELKHKIHYDFAVKNALVEEYLKCGGPFFVNFYQNLLKLPESYLGNKTFGTFKKVPAIICGAGPSLEKHLKILPKLLDKALVFAGGSALNALNAAHIQPHLGAGIDPNPAQYTRLSSNQAYEVPFYYRNRMYYKAFEEIHGPRLYITGTGGYDVAQFFEEKLKIEHEFLDEGHNVINFCLQIAHQLGCDPIIFVGMDLAFTGMKSYAPGVETNVEFDAAKEVDEFDEKPLPTKDIFGKPTFTLWKWVAESEWIGEFAKNNPNVTIINATEGGIGFPNVSNQSLKKVLKDYLERSYPIHDRLHGEIQNCTMPHVTFSKVRKLMQELEKSLHKCIEYFEILEEDTKKCLVQPGYSQSGLAALSEIELAEEPGYIYVLDIFNAVQARLFNHVLHEIKNLPEQWIARKKGELNLQRFDFLKKVAKVNIEIIQSALQAKNKRSKKGIKSLAPHSTPVDVPLVDYSPLLLPACPVIGMKVKDHYVTIMREYDQPMNEAKLCLPDGTLDGQCLLYYSSGTIKAESFYKNGVLHGPSSFFSLEGKVLSKSYYKNGKQEGECRWYYPSGALYSIQHFKRGYPEGTQEYYYPDGSIKTIVNYRKGKICDIKKS